MIDFKNRRLFAILSVCPQRKKLKRTKVAPKTTANKLSFILFFFFIFFLDLTPIRLVAIFPLLPAFAAFPSAVNGAMRRLIRLS